MADSQNLSRLLNPWLLHIQKLALELKCPFCLNLLNRPMLLPCNHIFCNSCIPRSTQLGSECPSCKQQYVDRDIRSAPYMENMAAIYKSLDATLSASLSQPVSYDGGRVSERCPVSVNMKFENELRKEPVEIPVEGNSSNEQPVFALTGSKHVHTSLNDGIKNGFVSNVNTNSGMVPRDGQKEQLEMHGGGGTGCGRARAVKGKELRTEETDMNQVAQLSPGSPPSFGDTKDLDGNSSDPDSSDGNVKKQRTDRLVGGNCDRIGEINDMPTSGTKCDTRDAKRQKRLDYELSEMGVKRSRTRSMVSASENVATSKCRLEPKVRETLPVGQSSVISDSNKSVCGFCLSSKLTDGTGPMLHFSNGKEVVGDVAPLSKVIHVHQKCIDWTPRVYYVGDTINNLELELSRAAKLKCSSCGLKGAGLGCYHKSCRKSYHVPCAYENVDCRWDTEDFLMLCPAHNSVQFPREKKFGGRNSGEKHMVPTQKSSKQADVWVTSLHGTKDWVFCGSALSSEEKYLLVKFGSMCGATVTKFWKPNVTHVIAATDTEGACSRTLKVLMAILNGRWILTMDWIKACMEAKHPVSEEPYEVSLDNHGCHDGPKTGRLRNFINAPKLFEGLNFYFIGDFVSAFKTDLLNLVITAGATVIEKKEQLMPQSSDVHTTPSATFVVYNHDTPQGCKLGDEGSILLQRSAAARDLADKIGSQVIDHTWILESIAACKLQPLPCSVIEKF